MPRRVLDPIERTSEVLFGLIMTLTFTGSLSAAESGKADVQLMLVGALGCNFAWGVVDAVMFLMSNLIERSRGRLILRRLREPIEPSAANALVAESLPSVVAEVIEPEHLDALRRHLANVGGLKERTRLGKDDWIGAAGVFILVFVSTLPLAVPFMFIGDVLTAMRVSNAVAIVMLFWCGTSLARYAGIPAWRTGLVMVLLGVLLVAMTMALGG